MEDRQYTNTSCPLYETVYCQRLNMRSCDVCPAKNPNNVQSIQADLDAVAQLMPMEDLAPLFHTEQCVLCKGEPGKRVCYGMTDLGNPEPQREGRNFIGMKTKLRIGSLLPIQLSCCAACRRKFQLASYVPVLTRWPQAF